MLHQTQNTGVLKGQADYPLMPMKRILPVLLLTTFLAANAQAEEWVKETNSGCSVWSLIAATRVDEITWTGDCIDGKVEGEGTLEWLRGGHLLERYDGTVKAGKPHGTGTLVSSNGARYEGEFKDGRRHGRGKQKLPNGAVYEGDFEANEWTGWGKLTGPNGESFEGDFVRGVPNGRGTYRFANGTSYKGETVNGKRAGYGVQIYKDGT